MKTLQNLRKLKMQVCVLEKVVCLVSWRVGEEKVKVFQRGFGLTAKMPKLEHTITVTLSLKQKETENNNVFNYQTQHSGNKRYNFIQYPWTIAFIHLFTCDLSPFDKPHWLTCWYNIRNILWSGIKDKLFIWAASDFIFINLDKLSFSFRYPESFLVQSIKYNMKYKEEEF